MSSDGETGSRAGADGQESRRRLVGGDGDDDGGGSSLPAASFNYINAIVGSGVIGMPFAIKQSGLALGLVALCAVSALNNFSLVLLIRSGELSGTSTYQDMVGSAFGTPGYFFISFLQSMYPIVAMTSHNVLVGDTVTKVLVRVTGLDPGMFLARREFVIVASTLAVTLPLSMQRSMGQLSKASFLSLVSAAFIAFAVVFRLFTTPNMIPEADRHLKLFGLEGFSTSIGVMTVAFMCHHNSFLLYNSLRAPDLDKWKKVTCWSVWTAMALILAIVLGVYLVFFDYTQGDLLNNYCWGDDLMNASRLFFAATILLTYPLELLVVREVFLNLLLKKTGRSKLNSFQHVGLTLAIVASITVISLTTDCLGNVLIVNGLFFGVPLAYFVPGACYLKLTWPSRISDGRDDGRKEGWGAVRVGALALVLFGAATTVHGTAALFRRQATNDCNSGLVQMPYCLGGEAPGANLTSISL